MKEDKISFFKYATTGGWLFFWIFITIWMILGALLKVHHEEGSGIMIGWGLIIITVVLIGNVITYHNYKKS